MPAWWQIVEKTNPGKTSRNPILSRFLKKNTQTGVLIPAFWELFRSICIFLFRAYPFTFSTLTADSLKGAIRE